MYVDMWIINVFYGLLVVMLLIISVKLGNWSVGIWGEDSHKVGIFIYEAVVIADGVGSYINDEFDLIYSLIMGVGFPIVYSIIRILYLKFR